MTDLENASPAACDECVSTTSPAAYFVWLLDKLKQIEIVDKNSETKSNLQEKLFQRRPDLGNLELSCANTKQLVPYIDLVNEILEGLVWHFHGDAANTTVAISAHNMKDSDTSNRSIARPNNINYELYKVAMPTMVSPLHILPFNQALFSIRTYLTALGTSRLELLSTFATDRYPKEVQDRAKVAEVLGLSYDDYIAIASDQSDRKGVWEYWGYKNCDDLLNDRTGAVVAEQLLFRAGFTIEELVRFEDSAYVKSTGSIDGGISKNIKFKNNVDRPCKIRQLDRLQQFIRLRAKLKWTIEDLDAILTTLGMGAETTIDSNVLSQLAAVQELATLVNHQPSEIQPLWGNIWTHGNNSLYQLLFLTGPHLQGKEREAFIPVNGKVLEATPPKKMKDNLPALLALLGLKPLEFDSIKREDNICDDLTLLNISALYRRSLFCSMLGISPTQYHELLSLYKHIEKPFANPQETLALVRQYLSDSHPTIGTWRLGEIFFVTGTKSNSTKPNLGTTLDKVLALVTSLQNALETARKAFKYPDCSSSATFESTLASVFGLEHAPTLAKFIAVAKENNYEGKVLNKTWEKVVQGKVTAEYKEPIDESNKSWEQLVNSPNKCWGKLVTEPSETLRRSIFLAAIRPQVTAVLEKHILPSTIVTTLRPSFPLIDDAMLSFLLSNAVEINGVSGIDVFVTLLQAGKKTDNEAAFSGYFVPSSTGAYTITSTANAAITFDGCELCWDRMGDQWRTETKQLAGGHGSTVSFAGNIKNLELTCNDARRVSTYSAGVFISHKDAEDARRVLTSLLQKYLLITRLHLSLAEVTEIHQQQTLCTDPIGNTTLPGLRILEKYCTLRNEFTHAGATMPLLGFYKWLKSRLDQISEKLVDDTLLDQISREISKVTTWRENACLAILRTRFHGRGAASILSSLKDISVLFEIRQCMRFTHHLGLPGLSVDSLYQLASPEWPPNLESTFQHAQTLRKALEAKYLPTVNGESNLLSTANDTVRSMQRTSLVYALLTRKYCTDKSITTPDHLFDHFLIDFQMGPVLQTSRIKQAISTVQVFVQRCINGNERLPPEVRIEIREDRDHDYMFRYRLWEASKKADLFPEQYIDPTLRDDKSDQFIAAEAAMMQSKLDEEKIERIVRDYIYQAEEVLDLQMEAYLWDKEHKAFHLFSRTRKSPPTFYYRKAEVSKDKNYVPSWSPWTKFPVEVPVLETDADGEKLLHPGSYIIPVVHHNRLLVFIPQIILRQKKTPSLPDKTIEQYRNEKPPRAENYHEWDIRLGYSELQNGKWSPKTVSQASVHLPISKHDNRHLTEPHRMSGLAASTLRLQDEPVSPADSKYHANIAHLKFWPRLDKRESKQAKLIVAIEWVEKISAGKGSTPRTLKVKPIADYVLIGHKLLLREPVGVGVLPTTLTEFGKIYTDTSQDTSRLDKWLLAHKNWDNTSTLTFPIYVQPVFTAARTEKVEWLVSLDDINHCTPTVLGCEVHDGKETKQYIGMPPRENQMKGPVKNFQQVMNEMLPGVIREMSDAEGLEPIYQYMQGLPLKKYGESFGLCQDSNYNETATPLAIYSWELGVHLPALLMERLLATHQLELALKVAKLMYDSSRIEDSELSGSHWTFPPFRGNVALKEADVTIPPSANIHASARANPAVYIKRIALKYVEILVGLGDQHFRRSTLESIPLALERYIEASEAFSSLSASIVNQSPPEALVTKSVLTYSKIEGKGRQQVFCKAKDNYRDSLRQLVQDRLYKIRNGLDINGQRQTLPLFAPPIDPGDLARAKLPGGGIAGLVSGFESPMPNYRFDYLVRHAFELVNDFRSLGQQFLTIREKKDAEGLALLRSRHQHTVLELVKKVKEHEKEEALRAIDVVSASRTQQEKAMEYYLQLTADKNKIQVPKVGESWKGVPQEIRTIGGEIPMSPFEKEELDKADEASDHYLKASVARATGAVMAAIPNFGAKFQPMGAGADTTTGGSVFARVSQFIADGLEADARRMQEEAVRAGRKGALSRALQERRQTTNNIGWELMRLDKERSHLQARCDMCDSAIKSSQQEIENAAEEERFLRTKYTGEQLYNKLDSAVAVVSHQAYQLALEMANVAQRALLFEHSLRFPNSVGLDGQPAKLLTDYWEKCPDGQLAGEALYLDLKRMEMLHMENRTHDFEITKNVSVRQLNPAALLQLREQGTADFSLPEIIFDMDFPGHYCRRIVSVAVSIPCILGAYTSLNCTLRLLGHRYRIAPTGSQATFYKESNSQNKFHSDSIPIDAIAISNGLHDSGTFTLDFGGQQRYGPFEGAGAISDWRLEFTSPLRQFDYHTISDLILHLRYTAIDGGGQFAKTAKGAVKQWAAAQPKGSAFAVDLKNEYPNQWQRLAREGKMELPDIKDRLPFWARREDGLNVCSFEVIVLPEPKNTSKPEAAPQSIKVQVGKEREVIVTQKVGISSEYWHFEWKDTPKTFEQSWSVTGFKDNSLTQGWLLVRFTSGAVV